MPDADSYTIRPARPDEHDTFPAIERAAAAQFRATAFAAMADAPLASEHLAGARDRAWVAVARRLDGAAHLHELDVHPAHARRGLGRLLIEAVAAWARQEGLRAVTLTTFRDIPWNAPYYGRLGFRPLDDAELGPGLRALRESETAVGLPSSDRLCMRLQLA